jgi:hypothetical protein
MSQAEPTVVRVARSEELVGAFRALGLDTGRPTLALIGGASRMGEVDPERLRPLFAELVSTLERLSAAAVDGGTDVGVMQLFGRARAEQGASFPLVGVVVEALASVEPAGLLDAPALEPNHSHVVLVPGEKWGDESPWIARVAGVLAGDRPSLTLLVNGGEISLRDVEESVDADRRVVTVDGSGRTADLLAAALRGESAAEQVRALAESGLVRAADVRDDSGRSVVRTVEQILSGGR